MWVHKEAHPCRLKAIHVLNTTSWIHHVMRLIMPLLKSELLGLITFHRGNTPDNFPTELLPIEYGGESATIPELERDTRFLLEKYRHWLIESTEYKSDESKRAKKTSWWGFFNGSNKSSEQMDEKTVLKNLQID
ncbi:hypothetical protein JTB14_021317 [Gonioctena quinquepunctata]|nr:hypothetical protein JTB14_021317 [Gonioctena quinquepunctata]